MLVVSTRIIFLTYHVKMDNSVQPGPQAKTAPLRDSIAPDLSAVLDSSTFSREKIYLKHRSFGIAIISGLAPLVSPICLRRIINVLSISMFLSLSFSKIKRKRDPIFQSINIDK
jgi:hypothetical protein